MGNFSERDHGLMVAMTASSQTDSDDSRHAGMKKRDAMLRSAITRTILKSFTPANPDYR